MSSLKKKRVKREVKAFIKEKVKADLEEKIALIKEMILENLSELSTYLDGTDSKIDLDYYGDILKERLEDFEYIENSVSSVKLVVPDIDNFNFDNLEFLEIIMEGLIGTYAEATLYETLELLGNDHGLKPINLLANPNDYIYLIQVDDWLINKEKEVLGYSLVRLPFSNVEPLYGQLFGTVLEFVEENITDWINTSIKDGMEKIKQTYGGL